MRFKCINCANIRNIINEQSIYHGLMLFESYDPAIRELSRNSDRKMIGKLHLNRREKLKARQNIFRI